MVLNRGPLMENENVQLMYDYSACIYPLGLVPEKTFYFNEEKTVLYLEGSMMGRKTDLEKFMDNGWENMKERKAKFKIIRLWQQP